MNKKNKWMKPLGIIAVIALVIVGIAAAIIHMLSNTAVTASKDDIDGMIQACIPYLIGAGIAIILVLIVLFVTRKASSKMKYLVRSQSAVAIVLILCIVINLICFGPASSLLELALADTHSISDETIAKSEELVKEIAEEGIVLLKNEENALPLSSDTTKLNVFGWSSINPIYGGTGSGAIKAESCVTLLQGLQDAGFEVNTTISDFYAGYQSERPMVEMGAQDWTVPEPTIEEYDEAGIFANAKEYSNTAVVVISRSGGENADLPRSITGEDTLAEGGIFGWTGVRYTSNPDDVDASKHYLELSNREIAMVERVTAEFDNVIVVVNSANPMELGWLDQYDSIDSALWCAGTGQTGFSALGEILNGSVNPSGKLVDTYLYDLLNTPINNNFGAFEYDNMTDLVNVPGADTKFNATFVNYVEGIYVGYKYYETAAAEGFIDYNATVQYPFGYGLSYTSFEQKIGNVTDDGKTITMEVTVTNTGDNAGKDVVEVYYTPPYYNGGIEKAEVNLIEFAKTGTLEPGSSETVTVSFDYEDMASYDDQINGCYVLEHGDYAISIRSDSHTVLDSYSVTADKDIVYNEANGGSRSSDAIAAENQFDFAQGDITYLSRADQFANYNKATAAPSSYSMSEEAKAGFLAIANYDPADYNNETDVMPTTGAKNGLKIRDMIGLDYEDSQWDSLLDELTVEEMNNLIAFGGYSTIAINSIDLPKTIECDGPASIYNNFNGQGGTAFPSAIMIAATWNKELAKERGSIMGLQCVEMNVSGWYGPAMNIHRSAFSGRNFEYYSEDGVLSGLIGQSEVQGAGEYKVATYIKHFALNDQETNRKKLLCTWTNEQSIREIYLKPFEMSFKDGGSIATMSSFNYIGNQYAGTCSALLQNVLRGEWGFRGVVVTDWFSGYRDGYMEADSCIRNGNDRMLSTTGQMGALVDDMSATSVLAMRTASHNILYALANSNAMSDVNFATPTWVVVFIGIDLVIGLAIILGEVYIIRRSRKVQDIKIEA
ncbi:glycoside hydrolase family 3 protein [Konateibacter massiliensis]|uniref:glycoside hydrolase family 3 protein n=1 Tax=Konateibacter massiliensis TaxID=2002841 RepID=UPI000C147E76|nr:glycoside hydrolase family 3 protein [Konateibacter massiliensis]